ncbi:hypothetical protein BJ741DRAFT_69589 [Chytriomyces cf. hyalinus JEL632]|nr:hypothetical protein BJ741DRAFT_69589 [Chytriomyces cf. hyalinus JEL632]
MHARLNSASQALEKANALLRGASGTNSKFSSPSRSQPSAKINYSPGKTASTAKRTRAKKYDWEDSDDQDSDNVLSDGSESNELQAYLSSLTNKKVGTPKEHTATAAKSSYLKKPAPAATKPPSIPVSKEPIVPASISLSPPAVSPQISRHDSLPTTNAARMKEPSLPRKQIDHVGDIETDSSETPSEITDSSILALNDNLKKSLHLSSSLRPLDTVDESTASSKSISGSKSKSSRCITKSRSSESTNSKSATSSEEDTSSGSSRRSYSLKIPSIRYANEPQDELSQLLTETKLMLEPKTKPAPLTKNREDVARVTSEVSISESIEEAFEQSSVEDLHSKFNDLLTVEDLNDAKIAAPIKKLDEKDDSKSGQSSSRFHHTPTNVTQSTLSAKPNLNPLPPDESYRKTNASNYDQPYPPRQTEQPQYPFQQPQQYNNHYSPQSRYPSPQVDQNFGSPAAYPTPGMYWPYPHLPSPGLPYNPIQPMYLPPYMIPQMFPQPLPPWGASAGGTAGAPIYNQHGTSLKRCDHSCGCIPAWKYQRPREQDLERKKPKAKRRKDPKEHTSATQEQNIPRNSNSSHSTSISENIALGADDLSYSSRTSSHLSSSKDQSLNERGREGQAAHPSLDGLMGAFTTAQSSLLASFAPGTLAVNTMLQNHLQMIQQYIHMNEIMTREEVYYPGDYTTLKRTKEVPFPFILSSKKTTLTKNKVTN